MPINVGNYENQVELLTRTNTIINDLSKAGKTPRRQVYTSNGTWNAPEGVNRIFITGGGGGGGGSCYNSVSNTASSGGATSFGNLITLTGGGGGFAAQNIQLATGGVAGGPGGEPGGITRVSTINYTFDSNGGGSGYFKGGKGGTNTGASNVNNGGYCSGGGGTCSTGAAGAGGGGDFVLNYPLEVVPGTSYPIIIGVGGNGTTDGSYVGGKGGNGILIIEWWE